MANLKAPSCDLQQEKTWIEMHPMSMAHIETTLIGWLCKTCHHPGATNLHFLPSNLTNSQLKIHLRENKPELVSFARRYPTLQNWTSDVIPPVLTKIMTPKWRANGKTFTTTAIDIVVPKTFHALLQKMVQEIELAKNSGKATFVGMAMSYARSPLHTECGKALFKHTINTQPITSLNVYPDLVQTT